MSPAKRRKRSAGARLRPFWIVFLFLALAASAGGYYAATWPGFYPQTITVSGERVVPAAQILSRAQIARYENVWLQSAHNAAARIAAIPYIKTATIHRALPARVHIAVTERTPFAVLENGTHRVLVDRDLRVLEALSKPSPLAVIVAKGAAIPPAGAFVRDANVARLRDDFDALAQAHVAVRSLEFDKFGDLAATTRGGVSLLLGDDSDLPKKTPLIDPIISQVSATGKKLAAVDLRAPGTPVVVYKR